MKDISHLELYLMVDNTPNGINFISGLLFKVTLKSRDVNINLKFGVEAIFHLKQVCGFPLHLCLC